MLFLSLTISDRDIFSYNLNSNHVTRAKLMVEASSICHTILRNLSDRISKYSAQDMCAFHAAKKLQNDEEEENAIGSSKRGCS